MCIKCPDTNVLKVSVIDETKCTCAKWQRAHSQKQPTKKMKPAKITPRHDYFQQKIVNNIILVLRNLLETCKHEILIL